jgi:hypothetical protein
MSKVIDLSGKIFSRLKVIQRADNDAHGNAQWLCRCECGNNVTITGTRLIRHIIKSCGCLRRDSCIERSTTHGKKKTRIYRIWLNMKNRCYNEKDPHYDYWGGRGITVCDEWCNDFKAFYEWAMSHGYADDLSVDRRNNDENYCPENCRWATFKEQTDNRRPYGTAKVKKQGEV